MLEIPDIRSVFVNVKLTLRRSLDRRNVNLTIRLNEACTLRKTCFKRAVTFHWLYRLYFNNISSGEYMEYALAESIKLIAVSLLSYARLKTVYFLLSFKKCHAAGVTIKEVPTSGASRL